MSQLHSTKILKIMKSVRPGKMWIDGTCFDIGHTQKNNNDFNLDEKINYQLKILEDGHYFTSFRLPSTYYVKLCNHRSFVLSEFESLTDTKVEIPKHGEEGNIVVKGKSLENVVDARNKLQSVISLIRDQMGALQFISIPILSDEIKLNFDSFKTEILKNNSDNNVQESIFQKPEKLHLTIVVFTLLDDIEKSEAIKALNECKPNFVDNFILKTGPLKIRVFGIDCMNEDYSKVNILYANAKFVNENEEDTLQSFVNSVSKHFYERGLVIKYTESVKLHVTLINTKYRKIEGRKRRWSDKKKTFDARVIMEKYKNFEFGESNFDSIHLSLISSKGSDGYYKAISVINI